uniref:COP9 signalosome complex subunit 8 n=1 Tax=Cacopsylla melanoneura TaxID=428564 RepID=A0A8D8UXD9_9HEMI
MVQSIDLANVPVLVENLERQELEAAAGVPSAEVYTKLLALYLLQNDLCNAKFLWKRTPQSVKMSHPEIGQVWEVGKHLWNGNYPSIYSNLKRTWSDDIAHIMKALQEEVQKRALNLISKAYSSIPNTSLSEFLGVNEQETAALVQDQGWTVDKVYTQPVKKPEEYAAPNITDDQLYILTQYVSFLEN